MRKKNTGYDEQVFEKKTICYMLYVIWKFFLTVSSICLVRKKMKWDIEDIDIDIEGSSKDQNWY